MERLAGHDDAEDDACPPLREIDCKT